MDRRGLPPGQHWVERLVVYEIAPITPVDLASFRLRLVGAVDEPQELAWPRLQALPRARIVRDVHCVTTWSVRAVIWEGVPMAELLKLARPRPEVRWALARCADGYTTSLPLETLRQPDSLVADRMNGGPLPPDHGHPLRLVVPSLYGWKSAKRLESIEFLCDLQRGFWEERGYHDRGEPWLEERFREAKG